MRSHYPELSINSDGPQRTDVRDTWVGSERAAEEVGVGRTQMWRLASTKWAPMQEAGKTPPVRVLVMGTDDRPEYKFLLADVLKFARERRFRKAQRRLMQAQNGLRMLMPILKADPKLLEPMLAVQRWERQRRRAKRQVPGTSGSGEA